MVQIIGRMGTLVKHMFCEPIVNGGNSLGTVPITETEESIPGNVARRSPSQARSTARKEAILDATRRLLARGELDSITTKRIAKEAKVPVGSVYYLYPDKFAIYQEILSNSFDSIWDQLTSGDTTEHPDWKVSVAQGLDVAVKFYATDIAFANLYGALRFLPQLQKIDIEMNVRLQALYAERLQVWLPAVSKARAEAVAITVNSIGDRLLQEYLYATNKKQRKLIVEEMKRAVIAYLEACVTAVGRQNV